MAKNKPHKVAKAEVNPKPRTQRPAATPQPPAKTQQPPKGSGR